MSDKDVGINERGVGPAVNFDAVVGGPYTAHYAGPGSHQGWEIYRDGVFFARVGHGAAHTIAHLMNRAALLAHATPHEQRSPNPEPSGDERA